MSSDVGHRTSLRARAAASVALAAAVVLFAVPVVVVARGHPHGIAVLGCGLLLTVAVWEAMLRPGWARLAGFVVACLAGVGQALLAHEAVFPTVGAAAIAGVALYWGATTAFGSRIALPAADRLHRPVVVINPRSGGGKAARHHVAAEARRRASSPSNWGTVTTWKSWCAAASTAALTASQWRAETARRPWPLPWPPSTGCRTPASPRAREITLP